MIHVRSVPPEPVDGRRRRGDATRVRLLEAAASAFAGGGYHATTFGDIMADAGVSKGACYHHFASKQALALAVLESKQAQLITAATAELETIHSPLERFFTALRTRSQAFSRDRSLRSLPRLATDLSQDRKLAGMVRRNHRAAVAALADLLHTARAAGELRPGLSIETVARATFAALVGLDELSERESGGADRARRTEDIIALLKAALENPCTTARPAQRGRIPLSPHSRAP